MQSAPNEPTVNTRLYTDGNDYIVIRMHCLVHELEVISYMIYVNTYYASTHTIQYIHAYANMHGVLCISFQSDDGHDVLITLNMCKTDTKG